MVALSTVRPGKTCSTRSKKPVHTVDVMDDFNGWNRTLSSWMLVLCSQTLHQSPLSGPHDPYDRDKGNVAKKEGRELASSSDWDAVPFDLLSQPFCWLTFSHWTTNSVNCGRASHSNDIQGTAALFASQKPGCLQWFQTQPSNSRGSPCIVRTKRKSSQGKAVVGASVSISTTRDVMKGTYTLIMDECVWNIFVLYPGQSNTMNKYTSNPLHLRMTLINTRLVTNNTFILSDFLTELGFFISHWNLALSRWFEPFFWTFAI